MVEAIIFDFGDIFINLKKEECYNAFRKIGFEALSEAFSALNHQMEVGQLTEEDFLNGINALAPDSNPAEIKNAWNTIIGEFPQHRLEFLKSLRGKYKLFLLTNTDCIHIAHFRQREGEAAEEFFNSFDKVYYSYEFGLRKPDPEAYLYIVREQQLDPAKTLFVDDRPDNCEGAASVGLKIWHLQVGKEDVSEMLNLEIFIR
jgi:putative hydrolase of the HAD superfamily